MNLILLNSVIKPSNKFSQKKFDNFTKKLHTFESRKLDNLKQSFKFIQKIGSQDIKYLSSIHEDLIEQFNDDAPNPDKVIIYEEKEDIFDN